MMKQYSTTMTQRGQVTVPAHVRRILGLAPRDKVIFEVEGNEVRLVPARFTLEGVRGSVPALHEAKTLDDIYAIAGEEHAQHVVDEMNT